MASATLEKLPRLAGVCSLEEAQRPGFSVPEAAGRLARMAFVKSRLALAAAAHLNSSPEWEVKAALGLHGWMDAEHAQWLRARLTELRVPAAALEKSPDAQLETALEESLAAADSAELVAGFYGVFRPALLDAIERYLDQTNPLADHPSCRLLKRIRGEEREAVEWGRAALEAFSADPEAAARCRRWEAHLRAFLDAAGSVDGAGPRSCGELPPARSKAAFVPDVAPRRDARFHGLFDSSTPADVVYLDESRPVAERALALAFKRVREMDVPEVVAGVIAETPGKPWNYYTDMLRQMWDEARHALLGEVALAARGIPFHQLPINLTFSYKLARYCSPVERHILLYAIEQSLMPARRGKRYEWEVARQAGDPLLTTFQDFDWADEVLHVEIARRQLRGQLKGGLQEARRRADRLWLKIERALEREPLPSESTLPGWWEAMVERVLGRPAAPVEETHVKDWRPLSG
jgi:hypothetical protein